ncbi:MAG: DUF2079 domain-containing protein [Candidatus Aenigmarchaeota archaeon]|nr:DUF2079 domain-containing protein [Candidatus Aenigmarchaeota archaeon]
MGASFFKDRHIVALAAGMTVYFIVMSGVSVYYSGHFLNANFDYPFADQAAWLIANGKEPFSTVRGINIFGDHMYFIYALLAPLYWLWSDPRVLLLFQSFALATAALPLYLMAKEKLGKSPALVVSLSFLLYPALQFLNLDNFHPVSLGVPIFLWAFYFLEKRRYAMLFYCAFLALITREEYALTVFALGVYTAWRHDRKTGIALCAFAAAWVLAMIFIIFPFYGGGGYVQSERLGLQEYGATLPEIAANMALNPASVATRVMAEDRVKYLADLLLPTGLLSLLSPTFLLALPGLILNLVIGWPYARMITYHHSTAIIPFVFISIVYSLEKLKKRQRIIQGGRPLFAYAVILLAVSSVAGNVFIGPDATKITNYAGIAQMLAGQETYGEYKTAAHNALKMIPDDASVSASDRLLIGVSQRARAYLFPNPFYKLYWGNIAGKPEPTVTLPDYVLLDDAALRNQGVMQGFVNAGAYTNVYSESGVTLFARSRGA